MTRIRQILFVPPAPLVWAQSLGLFARQGVDVETTLTVSSDQLGQGLADGTWDLGIAVVDNILAWNQERRAGLRIVAQLERSTVLAFCVSPQLRSLAEAAAGPIAVDATTNGFVLVLYRALARAGIDWRTCRFDAVGGVRQRFEALEAGRADATILVPPFIDRAIELGLSQRCGRARKSRPIIRASLPRPAPTGWQPTRTPRLATCVRCWRRTPGPRARRTATQRWQPSSPHAIRRPQPDGSCATSCRD